MSYQIYLFRKEVKEQNQDFEFLENDDLILDFSKEQFENLKERILKYKYKIESENASQIRFKHPENNAIAILMKNQLSFSSGFSVRDIFEIEMTASEFTDTGEFAKLNPQKGE